jgi:hypothetical protein
MHIKISVALMALLLVTRAQAALCSSEWQQMSGGDGDEDEPMELDSTLKATADSSKDLITNFLNIYDIDGIVCPEEKFKALVVSRNALCQTSYSSEAIKSCRDFGEDCISIPGEWGCGVVTETMKRGCFFRPSRTPSGKTVPKVTFDHEDEDIWYRHPLN